MDSSDFPCPWCRLHYIALVMQARIEVDGYEIPAIIRHAGPATAQIPV